MFCCFLHGWYSTEAPCPACHQTYTTSSSDSASPETVRVETENKEWQIVKWKYKQDGAIVDAKEHFSLKLPDDISLVDIYSVKRLSDGEVFIVGDEVGLNWYTFTIPFYIKEFILKENKMFVRYDKTSLWELPYIRKTNIVQPLSGTMITLEECERQKREVWLAAREKKESTWGNGYEYQRFEDYQKQSIKHHGKNKITLS